MKSKKQLSEKQRAERLAELIRDAKQLGFSKKLVQGFKKQLKLLQEVIQADKERKKLCDAKIRLDFTESEVNQMDILKEC